VDDLCHAYLAGQPIQVLDVRQQGEWESSHVPNSLHVFVGDLPTHLDTLPKDKEVWTTCAGGYRSAIAASLLDRAGVPVRVVAKGGVPEWLARCYPQQGAANG
jgi:hydroxyacylglutathione hydrolase